MLLAAFPVGMERALRHPKPDDRREDRATALAWMIEFASDAGAEARLPDLIEDLPKMRRAAAELNAALIGLSDESVVRRLHAKLP